jgi:hypothetical protein
LARRDCGLQPASFQHEQHSRVKGDSRVKPTHVISLALKWKHQPKRQARAGWILAEY